MEEIPAATESLFALHSQIKLKLNFPSMLVIFVEALEGEEFAKFYRSKVYEKNNFHICNYHKFSGKMQEGDSN